MCLRTIGTPGQPGAPGKPFNQPTREGDVYVSEVVTPNRLQKSAPAAPRGI